MAQHGGNPGARLNEDSDGCDLDFQKDPTSDAELPAASGGVQPVAAGADGATHDHSDGCDLKFDEGALTNDEELPVAAGGVA